MDLKTKSIIIGGLMLSVLVIIFGLSFYLIRVAPKPNNTVESTSVNSLPTLPPSRISPTQLSNQTAPSIKIYAGQGFAFEYPRNWGILTCSNSKNVELDPYSNTDVKNVTCDVAAKPVTILVADKLNCQGESLKIGSSQVVKLKNAGTDGDIAYRWCVSLGDKKMDITHRVSKGNLRATSKDDFSAQIEQMIGTFKITPAGS